MRSQLSASFDKDPHGARKVGPQMIAKLVFNFKNYCFFGTYNYSYCDL